MYVVILIIAALYKVTVDHKIQKCEEVLKKSGEQ